MTSFAFLLSAGFMLLMPFFALAQHHWLLPDPALVPKKTPVRLSILYGDSLRPKPGSDLPTVLRFAMYQGKDSFSLKEVATGTNAVVNADFTKESFLAGAVLQLPEKNLLLPRIQKQLTKEQKALLALKDTSEWRGGIMAENLHYVKGLVTSGSDKGKTAIHGKQLNHELEILLNTNPASIKPGDRVVLQVLLHQRVLPNHTLTIWRQEKNGKIITSEIKTNKYGVQLLTVGKPGNYVVHVSQEGPHKVGLTEQIKWKSLEASYFFSVE